MKPVSRTLKLSAAHRKISHARRRLLVESLECRRLLATVGYWKFDHGTPGAPASGTEAILDYSENGLNGTALGAPVYRDVGGSVALVFDGEDDRVIIQDDPRFQLTQSLTLEAIVRIDSYANSAVIVWRGDDRSGNDPYAIKFDGDWQNDWFRSTQRATHGTRSAEVDGSATNATLTLAAPVNLTGYTSAELTFDWLIESGFDAGEFLAMDISTNGGASWIQGVRQLNGNVSPENVWHTETVDLMVYPSSNLKIRFRSTVSGSSEDANVDNVKMVGRVATAGAASSLAAPPIVSAPMKTESLALASDYQVGLEDSLSTPSSKLRRAATIDPLQVASPELMSISSAAVDGHQAADLLDRDLDSTLDLLANEQVLL